MHYCRIPAAYLRDRFGFERLPDFDEALWHRVKAEADGAVRPLPDGLIAGSDVDGEVVERARANLRTLPSGENVALRRADFRELPPLEDVTLVVNPPYGVRMGRAEQAASLITELGDFLKQKCTGSTAYIYVGKPALLKSVGLRSAWKKPLVNGALEGRLARFDLY